MSTFQLGTGGVGFGFGGIGLAVADSYAAYGLTPTTRLYCVDAYCSAAYCE